MAGNRYTSPSQPANDAALNGGLNSTSGPLGLQNNESSDLQNIDFNKFGSILKRNGYTQLNTTAITNDPASDGLHWFEYVVSGTNTRKAVKVADGKLFKMDDLDGTWDDITGGLTITAGNHCDFTNFLNTVHITNGADVPFSWDGTTASTLTVPTGLTTAKYNAEFNNYLIISNVVVSGTSLKDRFYWYDIKSNSSISNTSFIEVAKDDGQENTGLIVLKDRMVFFKERSIYNVFFTGDPDIPFFVEKSNSAVGCNSPFSIQEVDNGVVFHSYDGFYYYDGNNSFKLSDRITTTLNQMNEVRFDDMRSLTQKQKNRYWASASSGSLVQDDTIFVWDWFNNAWSVYKGLAPSAMATFFVNGTEERPYFDDYDGFTYQADNGSNDNPLGVQTAISAYYYTNWRPYADLVNQKGTNNVQIYHQNSNAVLTFAWSFNFEDGDQYSNTFSLATSGDVYGSAIYDSSVYAGIGGDVQRRDLTGRGRVHRMKFENNNLGETFQIDGIGTDVHLETNV